MTQVEAGTTRARPDVDDASGRWFEIAETQNVRIITNDFEKVSTVATLSGDTRNVGIGDEVSVPVRSRPTLDLTLPKPFPGGMDAKIPDAERRGRDAIIVDEWGPYDWKSPKLWPEGRSDAVPIKLRVLGPAGEWKAASARGATIEPSSGRVPGSLMVTPSADPIVDIDVQLTYRGDRVTSPRGSVVAAGAPYTFGYSRYFVPVDWQIQWFAFDPSSSPDKDAEAFARLLKGSPVKTERQNRLDFISGGELTAGVPRDRVAAVATGQVTLPPGAYSLRTISDDGIRVWVDDALVIDRWSVHESIVDTALLAAGAHRLRVEYFEATGFAEFRVEIVKADTRR